MLEELLENTQISDTNSDVDKLESSEDSQPVKAPVDVALLEKKLKKKDAEIKALKLKNKQFEKKITHMEEYANWHKEKYEQQCQCNVEIVQNFQRTLDTLDQSLPDHIKALYDNCEEAH